MVADDFTARLARVYVRAVFEQREREAREVARRTLRPRLRWAVRYPKVLALLKRTGLWRPPTMVYQGGAVVYERVDR